MTVPVVLPALIVMSSTLPLPSVKSVPSVAPEKPRPTVTFSYVVPESVAVIVTDEPAFSLI